jgi:hypothetical protein
MADAPVNPFINMPQEQIILTLDSLRTHIAMQERLFGSVSDYLKASLDALEQALATKAA